MALQVGIHKFTGRLENIIGYRRNGRYFFRSMPDKIRQTAATRRAARYFGIASRKGKLIRSTVRPHLDIRYDGTVVNRLNKLFIQSGRDNFPQLQGFRFNHHSGLDKLFTIPPVFTVSGTLHIPAQELEPQGNNTHLEVRLLAVRMDFRSHRVLSSESSTAIIELDEEVPFRGLSLNVPTAGEGVLMVILQCRACKAANGVLFPSGDRRYMAADVIHLAVPADQVRIPDALIRKACRKRFVFRRPTSAHSMQTPASPSLQGLQSPRGEPHRYYLQRE
ncbi:hypothetical protein [uncultured Chitinophaga sp.]|jgi:hypothetical protein|uniref:hypothetical protein n=1 Tax=uncultured Chitinophaga sp. TaxID=339340 RepID=UPI00261E27AA|nr:hypothetical protein [uncultured Chitinophaga sp.]